MDQGKMIGLLLLATGIADVVLARQLSQLSSGARTVLYLFGGAFIALGAMLLFGYQRTT
jgi:hypothetical protein